MTVGAKHHALFKLCLYALNRNSAPGHPHNMIVLLHVSAMVEIQHDWVAFSAYQAANASCVSNQLSCFCLLFGIPYCIVSVLAGRTISPLPAFAVRMKCLKRFPISAPRALLVVTPSGAAALGGGLCHHSTS
jgi:hypothetical protein